MIVRLLVAIFGAAAITIGLFLFMNDVANRFVLRDPTQYFAIADFIRAPDRGRQLPEVPVIPEATPDRPQLELDEEELLSAEPVPVVPEMEGIVPTEDQLPLLRETENL
jgi:hypothetical protein